MLLLPLGLAFALIALGELGDKTQLLVVSLASRYSRWTVLLGAIVAEIIMAAVAVAAGSLFVAYVPVLWISVASGLVFVALGIPLVVRKDEGRVDPLARFGERGILFSTLGLVALGELGDKTQLFIVALTVQYSQALLEVFIGAVLGEVLMMVIGVLIGDQLAQRLPRRRIRVASGAIFIVAGVLLVLGTLVDLPW